VLSTLAVILLAYRRLLVVAAERLKVWAVWVISVGVWRECLPLPPHMAMPCSEGVMACLRTAVRTVVSPEECQS